MAEHANTNKRAAMPDFAQLGEALISDALGSPSAGSLKGHVSSPEAAMERLGEALEHTQRLAALGTIAGMIAHEFNNILTPMMAYSQMALENPDDRELSHKALERAVAGSQRAAEIATAILGFSRDEFSVPRGTQTAAAGVAECVKQTLSCLARQPSQDGITLEINIDSAVDAKSRALTVAMRPVALQHVLLNLILNARKAMNPGGGRLTVSAHRLTGENTSQIEITIEDTGRGIEASRLSKIFEPHVTFDSGSQPADHASGTARVRTQSSTPGQHHTELATGTVRGFGLGLVVCKRLVEEVGGRMWIESELGRGTVVGFRCAAA